MGEVQKNMKTMSYHGFTQFDFTKKILQNLNKFKISPIAKLVLVELSTHYNPKNTDVFPKQKTLALKIGCSERSIVRAIQELFKTGIILIECKHTNRYIFSQYCLSSLGIFTKNFNLDNLSDKTRQNDTQQDDNLSVPYIHEQIIKQTLKQKEKNSNEDNNYLLKFAEQRGVKNKKAYINVIKKNGNANQIIKEMKQAESRGKALYKESQDFLKRNEEYKQNVCKEIPQVWLDSKKKLIEMLQKS